LNSPPEAMSGYGLRNRGCIAWQERGLDTPPEAMSGYGLRNPPD